MPYINPDTRWGLVQRKVRAVTPGELNYLLTTLVLEYLGPAPSYEGYNAAVGALECCKLEIYRRMIAPYEQKKCELNGDVFPCQT